MSKYLDRRHREEEGFTLIELMVVVLIMGILMAIAIPTFLSTRGSAQDAGAKSNATNALTAEKAYFADNQAFVDGSSTLDNNLPWLAVGTAYTKGTVNVGAVALTGRDTTAGQALVIASQSTSGNCFYVWDDESVSSGNNVAYQFVPNAACTTLATTLTSDAPTSASPVVSGSAGQNPQTSGLSASGWYSKW